jgi:hypothetical protein
MVTIAVTAERHGEPRVALSPEAAKKLTALTGDLHHARPIHEILRHRPRHPVPGHHLRCALAAGLRLNESERPLGVPVDSIQPGAHGCSQAEVSAVPSGFERTPHFARWRPDWLHPGVGSLLHAQILKRGVLSLLN